MRNGGRRVHRGHGRVRVALALAVATTLTGLAWWLWPDADSFRVVAEATGSGPVSVGETVFFGYDVSYRGLVPVVIEDAVPRVGRLLDSKQLVRSETVRAWYEGTVTGLQHIGVTKAIPQALVPAKRLPVGPFAGPGEKPVCIVIGMSASEAGQYAIGRLDVVYSVLGLRRVAPLEVWTVLHAVR